MPEEPDSPKQRQRSPNYPSISLRDAVERIQKLYQADGRAGSPMESAVRHFGFNRPHGTAMAVVSALKKYGLIEATSGRVNLTQRAVDIVVYPEGNPKKTEAIKAAALTPEIYDQLYTRYFPSGKLPSELSLKAELEAELKFNPKAVGDFVRDFRDTLLYAGLLKEDGLTFTAAAVEAGSNEQPKTLIRPKIGDFVQWEPQGVLQFKDPKRVKAFSEDGKFAFVEGSNTGLPIDQLSIQSAPSTPPFVFNVPPEDSTMREDVFSLSEGQVRIQWPTPLSEESIQDLKDWLKIVERKIARSKAEEKEKENE